MHDEDDVRETRGLPHGQARWGEPVRNGDAAWERGTAEARAAAADSRRKAEALNAALMEDVSAGLRVLVTRDGVPLTEAQVRERAANIVSGLVGNFRIERLDGVRYAHPAPTEADFASEARIR